MSSSYKVITAPTQEPITLAQAKTYLRVDFGDDDSIITGLISSARSFAETVMHRALATQTIQQVETIERPEGGELSGPINKGPSWYQYQEQLGANPFGAAQFYFDFALPPIQAAQPLTIETRVVAFQPWQTFAQVTNPDGSTNTYIDDNREPARLYIMSPITANFWRFTYTAGYSTAYPMPPDLQSVLLETIGFFYENREAGTLPDSLMKKLLAHRVDWL